MKHGYEKMLNKRYMSFDCYGTIMDWENGILDVLNNTLKENDLHASSSALLEQYAKFESEEERGAFKDYKTVLKNIMQRFCSEYDIDCAPSHDIALIEALKRFAPFPDSAHALRQLSKKYQLCVLSNIDRDLFTFTSKTLGIKNIMVVTSEDVRSYKPDKNNFVRMLERLDAKPEDVIHVAQSVYHDIAPASELGIKTVHVVRTTARNRFGATPESRGVADFTVGSLQELADMLELTPMRRKITKTERIMVDKDV